MIKDNVKFIFKVVIVVLLIVLVYFAGKISMSIQESQIAYYCKCRPDLNYSIGFDNIFLWKNPPSGWGYSPNYSSVFIPNLT